MQTLITRLNAPLIAFMTALMLAACNPDNTPQQQLGEDRIAVGISTEGEVRIIYGQPSMVWEEDNGARTLEFVKGPAGHRTFMIGIGSDGKVKSIDQVLKPSVFMKVVQGMSVDQVRRLIGKPGKVVPYALSKTEGHFYRYLEGTESRYFVVQYDANPNSANKGLVDKTMMVMDEEAGGNR